MAIAFDSFGSQPVTTGSTSATLDITAAAAGAWCYAWMAAGASSGSVSVAATGWTAVQRATDSTTAEYGLLRRLKLSGDTTFTVTWSTSGHGELTWASWTGVDGTTPDEASAIAVNAVTSRTAVPTPSATPTAAARWAAGFFSARTSTSANKSITWTPDAAQTERADANNSAAASATWHGNEIADTAGAVTQAAHSYTATHAPAAESHDASAILFLIPAAASAGIPPQGARRAAARTPALPAQRRFRQPAAAPLQDGTPGGTAQRRETWPRGIPRRGHVTSVVPPQLNPPYPFAETAQRRETWARGLPRRGRQWPAIPPQLNPPYPFSEVRQQRQPRGFWPRRGHGVTPVPAQAAVQAPAFTWQPLRHARVVLAAVRRHAATVPPAGQDLRGQAARHPAREAPPRRGRAFTPPPGQDQAPPGPSRRARALFPRHPGHAIWPPPAQAAAPAPAWPPSVVKARPRGMRLPRGRPAQPPWPQQAAAPAPPFVWQPLRHARSVLPGLRRHGAVLAPAAQDAPPAPGQRRRGAVPRRAGRPAWPLPAQAAAPAPANPAPPRTQRRIMLALRRRFRQLMPWPQATQPPFTAGTLTAASAPSGVLTATGASSTLTAGTAASGTLTAGTTPTGGPA